MIAGFTLKQAEEVLPVIEPGLYILGTQKPKFFLDFSGDGLIPHDDLSAGFAVDAGGAEEQLGIELLAVAAQAFGHHLRGVFGVCAELAQ
ncbi:MAG: hypothetical protein P8166_12110 [Candidatus Thiodiazotropha sp.]